MASRKRRHEDHARAAPELIHPAVVRLFSRRDAPPTENKGKRSSPAALVPVDPLIVILAKFHHLFPERYQC